jgi:hypothetical protein
MLLHTLPHPLLEEPIGDNDDDDATCAVCYVSTRETQLMLPAKTSCPTSWTREYYGYLMSGINQNSGRSSFICVDRAYEPVPGSQGHRNGGHLHPVEAICGTMQCPPYVNYKELTYAVCTK